MSESLTLCEAPEACSFIKDRCGLGNWVLEMSVKDQLRSWGGKLHSQCG